MMKKTVITKETLSDIKRLFINEESFLQTLNPFDNNSNKESKIDYISKVIDGEFSLDYEAFEIVINELITIQKSSTCKDVIEKVSDVKSQENFGDFITFTQDEKDYYVIGDLHADMNTFMQIVESIKFKNHFENINLIFLGDYVDRGSSRTELINKIILLKYLLPNNIHLLRGNHELYNKDNNKFISPMLGAESDSKYFFSFFNFLIESEEYLKMNLTKEQVENYVRLYAEFFDSMPTLALFNFENIKICAVHGGLPRAFLNGNKLYPYDNFNELLDKENLDSVGIKQKINMLWSDPYDGFEEGFRNTSDVRFAYSKKQFELFCQNFGIDVMLRAHEAFENGFKTYFDNRLISVFSSGGKDKERDEVVNNGSYYSEVSPNILRVNSTSITSLNINFVTEPIISSEERFNYEDIKKAIPHESSISTENIIENFIFDELKHEEDTIRVFDMFNKNAIPFIVKKSEKENIVSYVNLESFYGVNKDFKFSIDSSTCRITNLGNIDINIGQKGAILSQNESVKVCRDVVVSITNGTTLRVVF